MNRIGGAAAGNSLTLCDNRGASSVIASGRILMAVHRGGHTPRTSFSNDIALPLPQACS